MADYIYKRQSIDDLVPGMVLGKMIVTSDGKIFLNEGAVLTLRTIQTLQLWGFRSVDIREECVPDRRVALESEFGTTGSLMISHEGGERSKVTAKSIAHSSNSSCEP